MSYDYSDCPQCHARAARRQEIRREVAEKAYGHVPIHEYNRLMALAAEDMNVKPSLAVEFTAWISIDDYEFGAEYEASCQTCGFEFEWKLPEGTKVPIDMLGVTMDDDE